MTTAGSPAITVSKLRKSYKDLVAVDGISFEAYHGEILGILGPNGSGKTTTLKSILGLITFDSGEVTALGMDARKRSRRILRETGAVLEGARNIYWHLSPLENLVYFAGLKGLSKQDILERADMLLEQLGLNEVRDKEVRQFSKGMKQKVALACAFIHDPILLLLDEPTLGLDVEISRQMRDWLRESVMERERSILVTSHNMDFIESVCDRVLIIKEGRILSHETLESLKLRFASKTLVLELDRDPGSECLNGLAEVGQVTSDTQGDSCQLRIVLDDPMGLHAVTGALAEADSVIRDFRTEEKDLEEIFLSMIREEEQPCES